MCHDRLVLQLVYCFYKMLQLVLTLVALAYSGVGAANLARITTESCGAHTMTPGSRMIIQSPNFPNPYTTDYRCQWEFSCPTEADNHLEIYCPSFQLESSAGCIYDRLIVTSRGSTATKCGTDSPDNTVTSTGWARFTFFSNSNTVKPGFRCYIWCKANPTTTPAATTTVAATTAAATTAAATTAAATTAAATTAAATTVLG